jgi:hypothetical protein
MTPDLEDPEIEIVKSTTVSLFRQIIHLAAQDRFIPTLERMVRLMRLGKFTGHIRIQFNQGGVKKIETEEEIKSSPLTLEEKSVSIASRSAITPSRE